MKRSIFERYGGFAQVSRIVTAFYEKILDSPVTSPYFDGIDMKRLIDHQTRFIATVMGGPASYTNEQLERAHARLSITEPAFLEAVSLLRETLADFDFLEDDTREVVDAMMARKNYVVTKVQA